MAGKTTTQDPLPAEPTTQDPPPTKPLTKHASKTQRVKASYWALDKAREIVEELDARPDVMADPSRKDIYLAELTRVIRWADLP